MSLIARGSIDIYRYRSIYQPKLLQCWRHQEVATLRLTKHTTVVPNEQCQQLGKSLEKMCILKIPIDYDNDNPNLLFFFLTVPETTIVNESCWVTSPCLMLKPRLIFNSPTFIANQQRYPHQKKSVTHLPA